MDNYSENGFETDKTNFKFVYSIKNDPSALPLNRLARNMRFQNIDKIFH